ncbi:uncharacterized protein LOC132544340 [Ylistrum balloti]|uniref:uncharacterized protein LOC132544340 n=1 Tax=Ylistrum balloti TaxID=509963 RepID=UPI0029059D86|nr:uncharacterized protein LOC132544340 [Ylistrum balloti]
MRSLLAGFVCQLTIFCTSIVMLETGHAKTQLRHVNTTGSGNKQIDFKEKKMHTKKIEINSGEACTWVIERLDCSGNTGVEVDVYLNLIDTDSVNVFNGPSSRYPVIPTQISDWSFVYHLPSLRSTERFITVVFMFRRHKYNREFRLRYRDTPAGRWPSLTDHTEHEAPLSDTCDVETLTASRRPKFINSPGYPNAYDNSLNCKWIVVSDDICNDDVIQVTIHTLSLESYDHLIIYDGKTESNTELTKLSGQVQDEVIIASGTFIVVGFKTDDMTAGQGFNLSYVRIKSTPSILDSIIVNVTERVAQMSVDFISHSLPTGVYCSRDGVIIQSNENRIFFYTRAQVNIDSEAGITVDGFRARLSITAPESRDFGMYKVGVRNKYGFTERNIFMWKENSAPSIQSYVVFSENCTIAVTFSSHAKFKVEWYKAQHFLISGSHVTIITERALSLDDGGNEATYVSMLNHGTLTELDFGEYTCVIKNDFGAAKISVNADFPETELPKLLVPPSDVAFKKGSIILSVNFESNIAYPATTWYRNDVQLDNSDKYVPELTWKGISSSEWLAYGYPSQSNVSGLPRNRKMFNDRYQYPSIGSNRTFTYPNANYSALLAISDASVEDLGIYHVVLKNDAGIADHVIDLTAMEVFPFATCDQADTIRLVCNVTSCSPTVQSWVHSIDGDVIRNLPGDQDGTVNTLTIPMCMYPDAGTYTCIAEEEDTGNDVAIRYERTTLTVRATPVILEPTIHSKSDFLRIDVPFYSHLPHHRVTWYRNGRKILSTLHDVIETQPLDVNLQMHGKTFGRSGHVTSMSVYLPSARDYGIYKIIISNVIGSSEHVINIENPVYANPVTSNNISVSFDGSSATLNVTFSSYHFDFRVKWYFRNQEIIESHSLSKYVIQNNQPTDSNLVAQKEDTVSSILIINCISAEDYGIYDLVVTNRAGQAVIPVTFSSHERSLPSVLGQLTAYVTNKTGEMSTTFYSSSGYQNIRWLKDDKEVTNDSLKYHIVNNDIDIVVSSNGEAVEKTGTITRLRVTSFEDKDYGRYTVQIYNDVGMTDRSVTLHEECT